MLVDAETRHEVHNALEGLIGPKLTKDYLDLRLEALEHRLGERIVREAVTTQTRWFVGSVATLTLAMIGSNYALVSALR